MASNYTEHYELCQWEATDQVQRTDFNADNAKVDAALNTLAGQVAEKADGDDLISLGQVVEQKAEISELTELDGRALRWALGSYVGTGTCGSDSPNQLDFSKTLGFAKNRTTAPPKVPSWPQCGGSNIAASTPA